MKDYEETHFMDSAVDKLCKSLMEEPHLWRFETYTFNKRGDSMQYWGGTGEGPIMTIWNGSSQDTVSSYEQGKRIRRAYNVAREKQASVAQQKVIDSLRVKEENTSNPEKKWWEFWK